MKQALSAMLLSLVFSAAAVATPVGPMNYQGRLLDNAGIPVTGSYNFVVKIYNDPTTGTLKYQETKSGVTVDDGVYAFKIGTGPKTGGDSLWDIDLWQLNLNDLYLEVVVNGETLTPRHELTSAPHAFTSTLSLHANTVGFLGGQSTDNVLVAICKSGKGVWLDIADKCLGPGSDFSVAAVGGSVVNIATLHSGTNFTGIDLTNANISGINFGSVTFDYAVFKNTTYNSNNVKSSCFLGASWDGAVDVNTGAAGSALFTCSIQSVTVKNMNISKWNLSGTGTWPNYYRFSAAELSACPGNSTSSTYLPHGTWICREQYVGSGRYMAIGLGAGLGLGSALSAADGSLNTDVDIGTTGAGINIQSAYFAGSKLTQDFVENWMDWMDFTGVSLTGNRFTNNSRMMNFNFDNARMDGVVFYGQGNESWSTWSLKNASLKNVLFQPTGANVPTGFNFTGAHLSNVYFPEVTNFNFTDAVLDSIALDVDTADGGKNPSTSFNFTNAKLTGNLRLDLASKGTGAGCPAPIDRPNYRSNLPGVQVYNANFLYDPDNTPLCASMDDGISMAQFSNCSVVRSEFATHARLTSFTNCTFKEVVVKSTANFYQATFTTSPGYDSQIWWEVGAICPNNTAVTTAGFSTSAGVGCNGKW